MQGSAISTPSAAATSAPTTMPAYSGKSHRVASCPAVNAPSPAKLAWHSEICPPMPTSTVIDRKIVVSASPSAR